MIGNLIIENNKEIKDGKQGNCSQVQDEKFTIPSEYATTGLPQTDLVIFVTQKNEPKEDYLAYASACQWLNDRATVGYINFNLDYFNSHYDKTNPANFEEQVETTLHEIIHVLGFNSDVIPFFRSTEGKRQSSNTVKSFYSQQTIRGKKTMILGSPELLKLTRDHFGCESAQGAQLENQDGDGDTGSHWERTLFYNEVMNPSSIQSDSVTSLFTLAFLKDSNWYADIDFSYSESMQWGLKRGCGFLDSCDNQYPEFKKEGTKQCSFYNFGYGTAEVDSHTDTCAVGSIDAKQDCTNPKHISTYASQTNEKNSVDSKCFSSNLVNSGSASQADYRCYQYACNAQGQVEIKITVGGQEKVLTCTSDAQVLQAPAGMTGTLTCPRKLSEFCDFPIPCENYCSEKGYCLRQKGASNCHCISGYAGKDCSVKCDGFINSSNQCVNSCGVGYYYDQGSKVCGKCNAACTNCNGPLSSQCTICIQGKLSYSGQCVDSCPKGTYHKKEDNSCQNCDQSCTNGCSRLANNCLVQPFVYKDNKHLAQELGIKEKSSNSQLNIFSILLTIFIIIQYILI